MIWRTKMTDWRTYFPLNSEPREGQIRAIDEILEGFDKGFFFRSLLEYSFMKHLEKRGFDLARDVRYERFRVPYVLNGTQRTYSGLPRSF